MNREPHSPDGEPAFQAANQAANLADQGKVSPEGREHGPDWVDRLQSDPFEDLPLDDVVYDAANGRGTVGTVNESHETDISVAQNYAGTTPFRDRWGRPDNFPDRHYNRDHRKVATDQGEIMVVVTRNTLQEDYPVQDTDDIVITEGDTRTRILNTRGHRGEKVTALPHITRTVAGQNVLNRDMTPEEVWALKKRLVDSFGIGYPPDPEERERWRHERPERADEAA